jgi:hypothetical protein
MIPCLDILILFTTFSPTNSPHDRSFTRLRVFDEIFLWLIVEYGNYYTLLPVPSALIVIVIVVVVVALACRWWLVVRVC